MAKIITDGKTRADVLSYAVDEVFQVKTHAHPTGTFSTDFAVGEVIDLTDGNLWSLTTGTGTPVILAEPVKSGDAYCIGFDALVVLKQSQLAASSSSALTYAVTTIEASNPFIRFI